MQSESWLVTELECCISRAVSARRVLNRFPRATLEARMGELIDRYYPYIRAGESGYLWETE